MGGGSVRSLEECSVRRREGDPCVQRLWVLAMLWTVAVATPLPVAGQDESSSSSSTVRHWHLSVRAGVTDLSRDVNAPGSLTVVGLERTLLRRFSLGAEVGIGSIDRVGRCTVGTEIAFPCDKVSWWPTFGVGARLHLFTFDGLHAGHYLSAQIGAHGPDFERFHDLGMGVAFEAVGNFDVGFELRVRHGVVNGPLYFFTVSRPIGVSDDEPES